MAMSRRGLPEARACSAPPCRWPEFHHELGTPEGDPIPPNTLDEKRDTGEAATYLRADSQDRAGARKAAGAGARHRPQRGGASAGTCRGIGMLALHRAVA